MTYSLAMTFLALLCLVVVVVLVAAGWLVAKVVRVLNKVESHLDARASSETPR